MLYQWLYDGIKNRYNITGWWLQRNLPLWKMMEWVKVSWDDDIPNMMGKIMKNVPNHQAVIFYYGQTPQLARADIRTTCPNIKKTCVLWDKMHMSRIVAFILQRTA